MRIFVWKAFSLPGNGDETLVKFVLEISPVSYFKMCWIFTQSVIFMALFFLGIIDDTRKEIERIIPTSRCDSAQPGQVRMNNPA